MLPKGVRILSTQRYLTGGASQNNFANFNLATHVGDDSEHVAHNRQLLIDHFQLPSAPKYLEQIHSDICLDASGDACMGDAVITDQPNTLCLVMTADCLPIFAASSDGQQVGVAHAGWKGIVGGVIESFISRFQTQDLYIHFGPAISKAHFEVGKEVLAQYLDKDPNLAEAFEQRDRRYYLDLYQAARIILTQLGVQQISGGDQCTYTQDEQYFSYRRDGQHSGRMANLIYFE